MRLVIPSSFTEDQDKFNKSFGFAVSLLERGLFDDGGDLIKAAAHKYLRRIPTGKQKPKWQYIYGHTSKHHDKAVQVGEKVAIADGERKGHYEVTHVHANGYVTVRHDESGKEFSLHQDFFHQMFSKEHQKAIDTAYARLQRTFEAAKQHGAPRLRDDAWRRLRVFERRFSLGSFKPQKQDPFSRVKPKLVIPQVAPDTKVVAPKAKPVKRKPITSKTKPVERKPITSKAETLARIPSKSYAWNAIKNATPEFDRMAADFSVSDQKYQDWKDRKGDKPRPYKGGELDTVNELLDLKGDKRVSGLHHAFDMLMRGRKKNKWSDVADALKILQSLPGLSKLSLPNAVYEREIQRGLVEHYKDLMEEAAENNKAIQSGDKGVDGEVQLEREAIQSLDEGEPTTFDTSFDFGELEPEDHNQAPGEAYPHDKGRERIRKAMGKLPQVPNNEGHFAKSVKFMLSLNK